MMRTFVLIGMVCLLALAGCGGDGERLAPPAFDLTGDWIRAEVECDSVSADVPPFELAWLDAELEAGLLEAPGLRVVQRGHDLDITDLETGLPVDGTISGDRVRYAYSEQQSVGALTASISVEGEGTALDADTVAATQDIDWTLTVEGESITVSSECTSRLVREAGA